MLKGRVLSRLMLSLGVSLFAMMACGPPPDPPPATPTNVSTNADNNIDGVIVITWAANKEEDLAGYRVYRATDVGGKGEKVYEGTKTSYSDTDVIGKDEKYETSFFYKVVAYDKKDQESPKSDAIKASTVNFNPPNVPSGLKVLGQNVEGTTKIEVSWDATKDVDLKGYYVYRREDDKPISVNDEQLRVSELIPRNSATKRYTYVDKNITPGSIYYYTVAAIDVGQLVSKNKPSNRKSDLVLDTVELVVPKKGESVSTTPTLEWKDVNLAKGYVAVIQKSSRGNVIWRSKFLEKTTKTQVPTGILTAGNKYYWYVYAYSSIPKNNKEIGNSDSELFNFET